MRVRAAFIALLMRMVPTSTAASDPRDWKQMLPFVAMFLNG